MGWLFAGVLDLGESLFDGGGAANAFGFVIGGEYGPVVGLRLRDVLVELGGEAVVDGGYCGFELRKGFMEVRNFSDCCFWVVAKAVAGLHGLDQEVGRVGDRSGGAQVVISAAQAGHGSGVSIEFGASCGEAGGAADFDEHL